MVWWVVVHMFSAIQVVATHVESVRNVSNLAKLVLTVWLAQQSSKQAQCVRAACRVVSLRTVHTGSTAPLLSAFVGPLLVTARLGAQLTRLK
jgi:hypothetical protein